MFSFLKTQKYTVILLVLGVFLVIAGLFDIKDMTKFAITARQEPIYSITLFGAMLSVASIVLYIFDEITLGWLGHKKITTSKNKFTTKVSNTEINVIFGRIENVAESYEESMVVLPANEFFDDECIKDKKSALGAYINHKFINQVKQVEKLIRDKLKIYEFVEVEKEDGVKQKSYGVGTGILLKTPINSNQPILFLSVTTKRAREGLRSEMSYIFQAVKKIQSIAADHRIDTICIPVMGSGHGGLRKEVALFGLLLAICDSATKPSGHHIQQINIIVYQESDNSKPNISKVSVKRLLSMATGMFV